MVQNNLNLEGEQKKGAKPKGYDIANLLGPVFNLSTAIGTLYFYRIGSSDLSKIAEFRGTDLQNRIRLVICLISSLIETKGLKEERQPPTFDAISQLTKQEVEDISERYLETMLFVKEEDGASDPPKRESSEDATSYLDRLLTYQAENHGKIVKELHQKIFKSTGGIFDEVRKSSSSLASTLDSYNQLARGSSLNETHLVNVDNLRGINEQFARQKRERTEELDMVRLTGQMTAESARTLKDLAEAATTLLEQLNERDKKSDESTKHQIAIAVWSVGISAVLALVALIVALFGYFQDKKNNEAGDKWQAELLNAVHISTQNRSDSIKQVQRLQDQIVELNAKVQLMESNQQATISRKKDGPR